MYQTEDNPSMVKDLTGKRIFIVEDDAIIRDLYKDVLSRQGCEICMAASGEEAVKSVWLHPVKRPWRYGRKEHMTY
jgi:hypothetical protein